MYFYIIFLFDIVKHIKILDPTCFQPLTRSKALRARVTASVGRGPGGFAVRGPSRSPVMPEKGVRDVDDVRLSRRGAGLSPDVISAR